MSGQKKEIASFSHYSKEGRGCPLLLKNGFIKKEE